MGYPLAIGVCAPGIALDRKSGIVGGREVAALARLLKKVIDGRVAPGRFAAASFSDVSQPFADDSSFSCDLSRFVLGALPAWVPATQ
jgi:hypothetical protein